MTTFWPKRDEDGRHVTDDKGKRVIIGECGGPIIDFNPACEPDPIEKFKPLSELLSKLKPEVVEQAIEDTDEELKCAKCDGLEIIALGGEIYNCECTE